MSQVKVELTTKRNSKCPFFFIIIFKVNEGYHDTFSGLESDNNLVFLLMNE